MAQYNGRSEQKRTRLADVIPVNTLFVFGFLIVGGQKCHLVVRVSIICGDSAGN